MKKLLLALLSMGSLQASAQVPQLVYDIYAGATNSFPFYLTVYNGKLHFVASEATNGRELRVYDGVNIPALLYNINPAVASAFTVTNNQEMAVMNNKLYFGANNGTSGDELMMYDGTNAPSLVYDINPGAGSSSPTKFFTTGSKILFNATDATSGYELFVYDGTNAPVLFDLEVGASSSFVGDFVSFNNKVYFRASTTATGYEIFVYDPATNSATLAYDLEPGAGSSYAGSFIYYNNKLYFTATSAAYGIELYSYDGSTATRLTDINPGSGNSISGKLVVYNNQIYFCGSPGTGNQLYKYDPSNNTASLVYTIYPGNYSDVTRFVIYGSTLYFYATTAAYGGELWMHNGVSTSMVADINPGVNGSGAGEFEVYNGKLYFAANDGTTGAELFSFTDPLLSVQNTKLEGSVTIMPNPTTGDATLQLSLNTATALSMQVTDIAGKLIWDSPATNYTTGTHNISVPLNGKVPGTYFYRLTNTNGTLMSSGKIIKQ